MNSLISVIVPVYNVEDYLDRCIESIINQTYKNLEIILVDDGSTDSSGKKCDEYALRDDRIKVFHKENGGVSSARNMGIDIATGDYIGFVDSDDYIDLRMYEILLKNAISNNVEISCCSINTINQKGEELKSTDLDDGIITTEYIIENFFFNENVKGLMFGIYNKIFSKKILKNIRFSKYHMGEDILFSFETVRLVKKIYFANLPYYYYCLRDNSAMTSKFSYKRFDYIEAITKIEDICKNNYDRRISDKAHNWVFLHTLVNYRAMIINGMKKEYSEVANKYKAYLKSNKACLSSLNKKRKIDYILSLYFPCAYKILR